MQEQSYPPRPQDELDAMVALPMQELLPFAEGQTKLVAALQRRAIRWVFDEAGAKSVSDAARRLGITRQALHGWMRRHNERRIKEAT